MSHYFAIDYFAQNHASTHCFHRSRLGKKEQLAYDKIRACLLLYKNSVSIWGIGGNQLEDIYQKIVHDNPNIFYVEQLHFSGFLFGKTKTVFPKYRFGREKANQSLAAVLQKGEQILHPLRNASEIEKAKAVHDYFCKNVVYKNDSKKSSYECVGPLVFEKGVCEGISKAVKILFDLLGMKSLVLHGHSLQEQLNHVAGDTLHAWNMVEIDGIYYHLDVTFDMTLSERRVVRYDYFCLSDKEMAKDHRPSVNKLPKCDTSWDYYVQNHLYMHRTDDYKLFLAECLQNGQTDIVVKLPFLNEPKKALKKLTEITSEMLCKSGFSGKNFLISYNAHQMVFHLSIL